MKLAIGGLLFVLGAASCVVGVALNSSTPIQVGPIPVIGGAAMALVGLVMFISAL